MADAVIYPSEIQADKDKLFACYSLVQQMIDEHNRQSAIASIKYEGEFRTYAKEEFRPRLKQVLAERNRLIDKLIRDNYTEKEWTELSKDEDRFLAAYEELCGNKSELSSLSTDAECPPLDELKAIDLTKLSSTDSLDPLEDFTTYTEVDPNSRITVTASKVSWTDLTDAEIAYVYKDKGVGHFDGDFEHLLTVNVVSATNRGRVTHWFLANAIGDWWDGFYETSESALSIIFYRLTTGKYAYMVEEHDGTSRYLDYTDTYSANTNYYVTVERDEAEGTYGTLYGYFYSDAARTTLAETSSVALHTSKKDFRYIYACQSHNAKHADKPKITGYTENLDLQEATTLPFRSIYPHILIR